MSNEKAVITGMGIICSLGNNRKEVLNAIKEGKNGLNKVSCLNLEKLSTQQGGEVFLKNELFPPNLTDKSAQLAYIAFNEALIGAGINLEDYDPYRIGLSFGTCNGNILTLESLYENTEKLPKDLKSIFQNHYNSIDFLNGAYNIRGPKATFITACAASNQAIGYAYDLIRKDQADIVIVGGSDSLSITTYAGFHCLQSHNPNPCSPFSEGIGISLGEGAGFLIIEKEALAKKRNARIHARIFGYDFNGDAYHATTPDITGSGAIRCMSNAIKDSQISEAKIDFICAHGTGTEANDKTESMAIEKVFGDHANNLRVTSTKALHGHTLGASGIIQGIMCIDSLNADLIPPIVNFTQKRDSCRLNYVENKPAKKVSNYFLANSFAFGGNNVSVVYGKNSDTVTEIPTPKKDSSVVITGFSGITPLFENNNALIELLKENNFIKQSEKNVIFERFFLQKPEHKKFRKIPRISQLSIQAVETALENSNYVIQNGEDIGLIWGVAKGPMKAFEDYYQGMLNDGVEFASALSFPHIVHNSIAGQISIAFGIKGRNTTIAGQFSPFQAIQYASQLIQDGKNDIFIVGGSDQISNIDKKLMEEDAFKNGCLSEGAATLVLESKEHALKRKAPILAEIIGFSSTSSYWDKSYNESYQKCIELTLEKTKLKPKNIDLHISCHFGNGISNVSEIIDIPNIATTQNILGTLESGTAVLNTILGILALKEGFTPDFSNERKVHKKEFQNILVSGASLNGAHYSFILKKMQE